jgi:hypothetical protein
MELTCGTFLEWMHSKEQFTPELERAFIAHAQVCPRCKAAYEAHHAIVIQNILIGAKVKNPKLYNHCAIAAEIEELTTPPDRNDSSREEKIVEHIIRHALRGLRGR